MNRELNVVVMPNGSLQTEWTEQILDIIKRSKKGVDVAILKEKTGFHEKKIRNVIYRSHKMDIISRVGRGVYLRTKRQS